MSTLLLLSAALVAQAPSVVAVGLEGSADAAVRTQAHALWVEALRGVEGLHVVALADVTTMLGKDVGALLASCADDKCRVAALGAVARGAVVFGSLDRTGPTAVRLELRVATATAGTTVRISRDVTGPLPAALEPVLIESAGALFPGRTVRPTAKVDVQVNVDGAAITVDGAPVGLTPLPALEVAVGRRVIAASTPDGRRAETTVEVRLGSSSTVELSLAIERSALPYALGGGAVALTGAGIVLGVIAQGTAAEWSDGCPSQTACAPGFTRERYQDDGDTLALQRGLANGLFVAAGAALVGAVVVWIMEGSP